MRKAALQIAVFIAVTSDYLVWLPRVEMEASYIHILHFSSQEKHRGQRAYSIMFFHLYFWTVLFSSRKTILHLKNIYIFPLLVF